MEDSKLTQEQKQQAADWVNSKAPLVGKCAVCGDRKWTIVDDFLETRPYHGGGLHIGGKVYAHFGLICSNCGNTQFINAVVSGLLQKDPSSKIDDASEKSDD